MHREYLFSYYTPRELQGWGQWLCSKRMFYLGGRVTLCGVTLEWMDYYLV